MSDIIKFTLSGLVAGVLGGMGMGGGTLLIPLLTIFCGAGQHTSQAVNLISFIPMAIVALLIHFKNGLVKTEGLWKIIVPAVLFAVTGSFLSKLADGDLLRKIFGGFLILLSVVQFFTDKIDEMVEKKR